MKVLIKSYLKIFRAHCKERKHSVCKGRVKVRAKKIMEKKNEDFKQIGELYWFLKMIVEVASYFAQFISALFYPENRC